jgi:hypothetical protein|tara:strand:- start:80 stop:412 length:333 start_codon:yes stop_codon:yes gene_type:complete
MKKSNIKIALILVAISVAIYIIQLTTGFPIDTMTGSAIKGVQKANKYGITDTTEIQLYGESMQILLQNDEFQLLLKDTIGFDSLINSPKFIEIVGDTKIDTIVLRELIEK